MNDIRLIEKHLEGRINPSERVAFETRIKHDMPFRLNVSIQSALLSLVRRYHEKKIRQQLNEIHFELMNTDFGNSIQSLFKS